MKLYLELKISSKNFKSTSRYIILALHSVFFAQKSIVRVNWTNTYPTAM